jgi:hypothetical protein
VNGGKKGKSQGIEGSANANDVWVWMRPHIRFCTIGNYDLLSLFLLIGSLPTTCKFHHLFLLFFSKHGAFQLRFHLFFFSILAPFFLRILLLLGRDSTYWNFLGESLGK